MSIFLNLFLVFICICVCFIAYLNLTSTFCSLYIQLISSFELKDYNDQMKDFERSRIRTLQLERINVQKKTFTKWCNSFLSKIGMEIDDLFRDLQDGRRLIKLLEMISGEKLGKPNQGKLKVHKIENVNRALMFIQTKIKLESIGAEDIVAGNPTLILGLIWTIILRFQIQDIEIEVENESKEKRSAKEALLLWCQRKTTGYQGVRVVDFTGSWRNGLAFNALVHSQRPDLFDYTALDPQCHRDNLNHAFDMAQKHLGISKLLDAEDIDVDKPDEKSVLTYVSSYFHTFAKMKNEAVGGKRVGKVIGFLIDIEKMIDSYELQVLELQQWISQKIRRHCDFVFPNSLDAIKSLMLVFNKEYRTLEKPPKFKQKSALAAHFYNINMQLTSQQQAKYQPTEGRTLHDLEAAWTRLEKAEHERELALKKELNRQEQLEQYYAKFDKKAKLREDWLSEMANILSNSLVADTSQLDATCRKQEAIGTDMHERAELFANLDKLAKSLINEDYFFKETVRKRNQQIQLTYSSLLEQFEKRKATLGAYQELESLFKEMERLKNEMLELETAFQSKDYGEYYIANDELLTKHTLLESHKSVINQHLKSINRRAQQFTRLIASQMIANNVQAQEKAAAGVVVTDSVSAQNESHLVKEKLDALNKAFELINVLANDRRKYLEDHRDFHKFVEEADEEYMWVQEKRQVVKSQETGHDLSSTQILINKQEQLEDELKFRKPRIDAKIVMAGERLIASGLFNKPETDKLAYKCSSLLIAFDGLRTEAANRRSILEDSFTSQQYFADANEAESWMKDRMALVSLDSECGRDEASAQALLQRHVRVQEEIKTYEPEIRRLDEMTNVLAGKRRFSSFPVDVRQKLMKNNSAAASKAAAAIDVDEIDEDSTHNDMSDLNDSMLEDTSQASIGEDQIELVDQIVETEVAESYVQEVRGYAVRALYPYQSKTFSMARGELLELKEKSNEEWWLVENSMCKEGFAPATYLKELELQKLAKQRVRLVKRPEHVQVKRLIPRKAQISAANAQADATVNEMNQRNNKATNGKLRRKTTSIQPRQLQHLSTEELQKRQVEINYLYSGLLTGSIDKRKQLDGSIAFYKWLRKYDEFGRWIGDKLQQLSIEKENSLLDNPDAAKRRYQAFNTDFLANQNEFADLKQLADHLATNGNTNNPSHVIITEGSRRENPISSAEVPARQADLAKQWQKLLELKKYWDNAVKAIQCIDRFNLVHADVTDLLNEKLAVSEVQEDANFVDHATADIKSVRALQSKQDKLERDIGPIEANVNELRKTADEVCKYFPQELGNVQAKLTIVEGFWSKLRDDVRTRKAKLDEKHGLQRFENGVSDFQELCAQMRSSLSELENPLDLKQCEDMQKKFEELEQQASSELSYKFNDLKQLSQQQLAKRGVIASVDKINGQLAMVANEKAQLAASIDKTGNYLEDFHLYLKFKQDANNFELLMVGQEAYLQYEDLGLSSDGADALIKRHDEFLAKLNAQDEKMKLLTDQLVKMNGAATKHFAINELDQILKALVQRRHKLKAIAGERKHKLNKSKEFFEFKNQCDDLNAWISERRRHALGMIDTAVAVDLHTIDKYLNKHEALEKEMNANRTRLDKLKQENGSSASMLAVVSKVEANWLDLDRETKVKGQQLQDTKHKADLSASLSNVDQRMRNVEDALNAKYNTGDLRSAKEALKKHNDLRKQLSVEVDLLKDLSRTDVNSQTKAAAQGSLEANKQATEKAVSQYMDKFNQLYPRVEQKQAQLEAALRMQQLLFDANEELKWIEQTKKQFAFMNAQPATLFEAQRAAKRQAELERSIFNQHRPIFDKLATETAELVGSQSVLPETDELKQKAKQLELAWNELIRLNEAKKMSVGEVLCEQTLLDEIAQVAASIAEKLPLIQSTSAEAMSGKEDTVLSKHLVKLEQLEADLRGYEDVLAGQQARLNGNQKLERKLADTQQQLAEMLAAIGERKRMLKLQQENLEFEREAADLLEWIGEKRVQAQSEDYGQDYEHLALINAKFQALKDEVKSCEEARYASVRKLSSALLAAKSPETKSIRKKIEDVKQARDLLEAELQGRELTLGSAAEIHCFNKDVQDLLRRISEKELAFAAGAESNGKDFQGCESLRRKHEIFKEELTALKVQLQELNKQSELLRERHPGDTAESVAAETDELIDRFRALYLKAEQRGCELKQASDYFDFLIRVRAVNEWMGQTSVAIRERPTWVDLFTVDQQKQAHDSLRFEMSQRDQDFKELEDKCLALTSNQTHVNRREIVAQTNAAMTNREKLFR